MSKRAIATILSIFCVLLIISGLGLAADKMRSVPVKHDANIVKQDTVQAIDITPVDAAPAVGEEINWQVISGGGTDATSTNFRLQGTIGQVATASGTSTGFILNHGYWQNFESGGSGCGDANGDGSINIGDVVWIVNYIFKEGPASEPLCISDANGDGPINIGDVVQLVNYIFKEGPDPDPNCCS